MRHRCDTRLYRMLHMVMRPGNADYLPAVCLQQSDCRSAFHSRYGIYPAANWQRRAGLDGRLALDANLYCPGRRRRYRYKIKCGSRTAVRCVKSLHQSRFAAILPYYDNLRRNNPRRPAVFCGSGHTLRLCRPSWGRPNCLFTALTIAVASTTARTTLPSPTRSSRQPNLPEW